MSVSLALTMVAKFDGEEKNRDGRFWVRPFCTIFEQSAPNCAVSAFSTVCLPSKKSTTCVESARPESGIESDPHPGHVLKLRMPSKEKIYSSVDDAVADVADGATIMFGGFGGAGFPNNLIQGLARRGSRNLSVISNNCGTGEGELGILFKNRQIRRVVAAFPGPGARYFHEQFDAGELELKLVPQGILCERMRAYGAGIPAFYSPVGVGTEVAKGKEERVIRGKRYILEQALGADFAFIKAHRADAMGNLVYRKAARNFNPIMATAAATTIVEVEEIVPVGTLDPEMIVTPSIFVDRIVQAKGIRHV